ncbi:MAG: hypothetical protein WC022_03025 [Parcubacteria group bacterium]
MTEKLKMLFWGMLGALGALALESLLMVFATSGGAIGLMEAPTWFMPVGVLIEELFAIILIGKLLANSPDKNNIFSRVIFFGLGFSLPEILLNFANFSVLSREILFSYLGLLFIHTATAGIFGCYFSRKEGFHPDAILFLGLAIVFHFAFNFSVLSGLSVWISLSIPLFVFFICFSALKMTFSKGSLPRIKN